MTTKITRNIIESFLSCKHEGHLKLAGQLGIQSDYQSLLATSRDAIRRCAFDRISASHCGEDDVQRDIALTPTAQLAKQDNTTLGRFRGTSGLGEQPICRSNSAAGVE